MDLFISNKEHFTPQDNCWTVLLWCFYKQFFSFWQHTFTAEHPALSQWSNAKFNQICSNKTNKPFFLDGLRWENYWLRVSTLFSDLGYLFYFIPKGVKNQVNEGQTQFGYSPSPKQLMQQLKGILHPKQKILSSIIYPHVVPNP